MLLKKHFKVLCDAEVMVCCREGGASAVPFVVEACRCGKGIFEVCSNADGMGVFLAKKNFLGVVSR